MSSGSSDKEEEEAVEVIFEQEIESSEDPPWEEWSSLICMLQAPAENIKQRLFEEGLYSPPSAEICTKYIAQSDSSVFRHPYYNYPAVLDPGIKNALLQPEEKVIYTNDGQELYLAKCKEMNQAPVRIFHESLLKDVVNLRYYCVDPQGVFAMTEALKFNNIVHVLDLTDNFLSNDASYHLGNMLTVNVTIRELILAGCRIGPQGAKRLFAGLLENRTLKILNLSRNALTEVGGEIIAEAMGRGLEIEQLNLSYNGLGSRSAAAFANGMEFYNKLTHLDLSKNNFFSPVGTCNLLNRLEENMCLEELNLAWNAISGPRIAGSIQKVMNAPNLRCLDLSDNKLKGEAIDCIVGGMPKAKKLHTLNLAFNPLDENDAFKVLSKLRAIAVKIQELYMDNVDIKDNSLQVLQRMQRMKSKKNVKVTFGGVVGSWKAKGPDPREIVLNRIDFLTKKKKKATVDIALLALELAKNKIEMMEMGEFQAFLKANGGNMINEDLVDELVNSFPGPRTKKSKRINISLLAEFVKRKWPDRVLPPTPPPPEPAPPPPPPVKGDKKQAKGKKK